MATRFAIANGNWSDPAIWDNGALPLIGDDVFANGFTVTIDQNVNVKSIWNTASVVRLPNLVTPRLSSNISSEGTPFYSGTLAPGIAGAWAAFDQNGAGSNIWQVTGVGSIGFQFNVSKIIKAYGFWTDGTAQNDERPASWNFEASNDGVSWTTLDSRVLSTSANTYYSYSISNTTSYTYYRLNVLTKTGATFGLAVAELEMTESTGTVLGGTAGGSFVLSGSYIVNLSNSIFGQGGATCLNFTGNSPVSATLNCTNDIYGTSSTGQTILHNGSGTLTINAPGIYNFTSGATGINRGPAISVTGVNAVLNINANIRTDTAGQTATSNTINISSISTINVVGNVTTGASFNGCISNALNCTAAATISVMGNLSAFATVSVSGEICSIRATAGNITITGNLTGGSNALGVNSTGGAAIYHTGVGTINITGSLTANNSPALYTTSTATVNIIGNLTGAAGFAYYSTGGSTLNITGRCTAGSAGGAVFSSSASATNILSGPFINNGNVAAVQAVKLLLTATPTYWQFQTAARTLYNASFAPDYPIEADVRQGVTYNGGLLTGTMIVPPAASVTNGVPVDNTTGTAIISASQLTTTAADVWDYPTSSMVTPNSIGLRIKNASTVDTTGAQLAAL